MRDRTSTRHRAGEVGAITVLKSQPRADEALELLRKIHGLVKPIMKKHGWYLPVLSEFFPSNPNLLGINVNAGAKICIRLRPAHDPHSFLPLEDSLLGTMLHELTHNVRGPHDDLFFKQLDALQDEFDKVQKTGYLAFTGSGNRVGEGVAHDAPGGLREAREKALRRLEEKERVRKILGQGGRLGGAVPDARGKRRGDILAEAAERRLRAKKMCGGDDAHDHPSGSKQEDLPADVQDDITRAERDSRRVVLDLTGESSDDDDEAEVVVAGPSGSGNGAKRVKRDPDAEDARTMFASSPELEVLSAKGKRAAPPPVNLGSRIAPSETAGRPSRFLLARIWVIDIILVIPPPLYLRADHPRVEQHPRPLFLLLRRGSRRTGLDLPPLHLPQPLPSSPGLRGVPFRAAPHLPPHRTSSPTRARARAAPPPRPGARAPPPRCGRLGLRRVHDGQPALVLELWGVREGQEE